MNPNPDSQRIWIIWRRITTKTNQAKELIVRVLRATAFFIRSRKYFCFSLFPTIVIGCFLYFGILAINLYAVNNLLNTIWEGLVAVLAVVFSIVLVAGQLASGYSPRMLGQVFKRTTLAYMLLFVFSALLPLTVLASSETFLGFTRLTWACISLVLAVACLSFLIPYFLCLKEWLKPERLLADLKRDGEKYLRQTRGKKLPQEVYGIRDLLLSSYQYKHYDILNVAIEALRDIVIFASSFSSSLKVEKDEESEKSDKKEEPGVAEQMLNLFGDVGCSLAVDPIIGVKVAFELGRIGEELVADDLGWAKRVLEILTKIGEISLEKKWDRTVLQVVGATYFVGARAMESNLSGVRKEAIVRLRLVFLKSVEDMPNVAKKAAYQLRGLGEEAVKRKFESETYDVLSALFVVALKGIELNWEEREFLLSLRSLFALGRKAAESELPKSAESATFFLGQIAKKAVDINEDWAGKAIFALKIVASKAAERPPLLAAAKKGTAFLREVGEACIQKHPDVTTYVTKQLWILGAESSSEELTSHILSELANLENKVGIEVTYTGLRKAQGWARHQSKWSELEKKLNNLEMQYFLGFKVKGSESHGAS
ncbi:MAG: DUF2254 domain-containing protein [archaeon]|nr:DUF2254 domain-containing protein [archaeon]